MTIWAPQEVQPSINDILCFDRNFSDLADVRQ